MNTIDWEEMRILRDKAVEQLRKSRERLLKRAEEALAKMEKWK